MDNTRSPADVALAPAASSAAGPAASSSGKPAAASPRWPLPAAGRRRLLRARPSPPTGSAVRQSAGAEEAALPGQGQERHLPVHVRRPQPGRYVRLQARALRARRQDDRRSRPSAAAATKNEGRVVGPKWKFKQYGQCGKWVSDLFPHLATCVDDIAFIHSMTADSPIHGSAMLQMNTGKILSGSPCLGSWVNYGLGSVNQNLPGFVVMLDPTGGPISGAKNWSSGYMPASLSGHDPPLAGHADPRPGPCREGTDPDDQRRHARHARASTTTTTWPSRADNHDLAARIASYELAFKMQSSARGGRSRRRRPTRRKRAVRHRRPADAGLRPQVPAGPPAGRARRALHPDLLRRRPQRRQLGRPRRPGRQPQPRTPATPTSRSPACSRT